MISEETNNIVEFYRGVFCTYAEIKNSIAQNISYNFDLFKIEPNNETRITEILREVFQYNGSKIIKEKLSGSEFKILFLRWIFNSKVFSNLSDKKINKLADELFDNLVKDLKITEFQKISDSSFKRNDGINQYGQLVDLAIMKNNYSSYLCLFMLDG